MRRVREGAKAVRAASSSLRIAVTPVAYSEAHLDITYRRTREQVASIVQATGSLVRR